MRGPHGSSLPDIEKEMKRRENISFLIALPIALIVYAALFLAAK